MLNSHTLVIKGAPGSFLRQKAIKTHFAPYGTVTKVVLSSDGSAFVSFSSAPQALSAKSKGCEWKGYPLCIEQWDEDLPTMDEDISLEDDYSKPGGMEQRQENSLFRVAFTSTEKLRVLEERDRFLRRKIDRDPNIKTATAMKGTCPDMCPEKERYLRETRRIVACYEEIDGVMHHESAVKQYSRSSADQEEPLQHELRPQPVLTMTMNYLISCIMVRIDEGEENLSDWYDFCWDRLRAIRKDIIQQQLCDLNTVTIVEQCARFHIACFDRLWGVKRKVFDEKINTENLMNCLQSLMHMYEDLGKQAITCPNEPEFNASMILLKLNSGDLLWEFNGFPPRLQFSPEIQNAIHIHYVYSNNMYSKFFKIVRETSYLNACLMQRYFTHVRSRALQTIIKAFCPPKQLGILPLKYVIEALKFDSPQDAIAFCEAYGLTLAENGIHFKISRNVFSHPDTRFEMKQPSLLVTEKRIPFPLAVVGSNSKVPVFLRHQVHKSFGPDHILTPDAVNASDQEEKMLRDVVEREILQRNLPHSSPMDSPEMVDGIEDPEELYTKYYEENDDEEIIEEEEDIFDVEEEEESENENLEEDEEEEGSLANRDSDESGTSESLTKRDDSDTKSNSEKMDLSDSEGSIRSHKSFTLPSSPKMLTPKIKNNYQTFWNDSLKKTATPFSPELFKRTHPGFWPEPLKKSPPYSTLNLPFKVPDPIPQYSRNDVLPPPSPVRKRKDSSKTSISNDDVILQKLKKKLSENMKKISARKYAKIWKEKVEKIKMTRNNDLDFGLSFLANLTADDFESVWTTQRGRRRNLSLLKRLEVCQKSNKMVKAILNTDMVDKLDASVWQLGRKIVEQIGHTSVRQAWSSGNIAPPAPIFWKLVFALPEKLKDCTFPLKLQRWVKEVFSHGKGRIEEAQEWLTDSGITVFCKVCIIEGTENIEKAKNLSTLILIRAPGWESSTGTKQFLSKLLSLSNCPIPVAILTLGSEIDSLKVDDLKPKMTVYIEDLWNKASVIEDVFHHLVKHVSVLDIKSTPLSLLVEETAEKYFDSLHEDAYLNEGLSYVLLNPVNIIFLYNTFLDYLEKVIVNCSSSNLYGTAYEFKQYLTNNNLNVSLPKLYNDSKFFETLNCAVEKLKLKELEWPPITSWELFVTLKNYCIDIGCQHILSKIIRIINPPDDEDPDKDLNEHLLLVNWLHVFEIIIQEKLRRNFQNIVVAYSKSEMKKMIDSHWWMDTELIIKANKITE